MAKLVLFLTTVWLVLAATPATAQLRDPFDPLVGEEPVATGDAAGNEAPGEATATIDPNEAAFNRFGSDRLGNTGADVGGWLVLAFALVLIGSTLVALARLSAVPRALSRANPF